MRTDCGCRYLLAIAMVGVMSVSLLGSPAMANLIANGDFESGPILSPAGETSKKSQWVSTVDNLNTWYGYKGEYTIKQEGGNSYAHSDVPYVELPSGKPAYESYKKMLQVIEAPALGDYLFSVDYRLADGTLYSGQIGEIMIFGIIEDAKTGFTIDLAGGTNPNSSIKKAGSQNLADISLSGTGTPGQWNTQSQQISINGNFDYVVIWAWVSQPAGGSGQYADLDNFSLSIVPEPSTYALFGLMLLGLIGWSYWSRESKPAVIVLT